MRSTLVLAAVLLAAQPVIAKVSPPAAGIVGVRLTFKTGNIIEGILLSRDADTITLEVDGGTVSLPMRLVVSLETLSNEHTEFKKRLRNLPPDDGKALWTLSQWAAERGMTQYAETAAGRVLGLDPEHIPARFFLGFIRVRGDWRDGDEFLASEERRYQNLSAQRAQYKASRAPVYFPVAYIPSRSGNCRTTRVRGIVVSRICAKRTQAVRRPQRDSTTRRYRRSVSRRLRYPFPDSSHRGLRYALPDASHRRVLSFR